MSSILDMQIAVLNDDGDAVHSILSELDRKTESEMFQRAADHFGFQTAEHHGRLLAMRAEIATVMGYKDESGLRKLCQRHDLETVSLGTFGQNVRMSIAEQMGLHPNDGKTIFVGWDAFLVAGMGATSPAAKNVQAYLLQMEKAGRVAGSALSMAQQRMQRISEANKVSLIASRVDRMQNNALKKKVATYLDDVLDGALGLANQLDLFGPTK